MTAKIVVATLSPDEDRDVRMKRYDDNLYRAKRNGRNQVVT